MSLNCSSLSGAVDAGMKSCMWSDSLLFYHIAAKVILLPCSEFSASFSQERLEGSMAEEAEPKAVLKVI